MRRPALVFPALLAAFLILLPILAHAAKTKAQTGKPERAIVAALKYPQITINPGEKLRVDMVLLNLGRRSETLLFKIIKAPDTWNAQIRVYGNRVGGIFLPTESEASAELVAEPKDKESIQPGDYDFSILITSKDGTIKKETSISVTLAAQEKVEKEISLATSYPVLRGSSDSKFEFALDVRNNSGKEGLFSLFASAPKGWEVSFKPAYEQKQISSLRIKGDQASSVAVVIQPPGNAAIGEYPVEVTVKTPTSQAKTTLSVVLTGTYEIKTGTANGLLSLATQPGRPANISFYVRNLGSAPQPGVTFMSLKPENWQVTFKPERLEMLGPDEIKQVEMIITPAEQALVGDYSVQVLSRGEKADSNLELRVTVKASSTWGWVGIAIIALVLLGLGLAFRKLGRR